MEINGPDRLLGHLLRLDSEGGDFFTVSQFDAYLGSGLFLMRRLSPHDGHVLDVMWVAALSDLAGKIDAAEIYEGWAAFMRENTCAACAAEADEDEDPPEVAKVLQ